MADPGHRFGQGSTRLKISVSSRNAHDTDNFHGEEQENLSKAAFEQHQKLYSLEIIRREQGGLLSSAVPRQTTSSRSLFESPRPMQNAAAAALHAIAAPNVSKEQMQIDRHAIRTPPLPSSGLLLSNQSSSAAIPSIAGGVQRLGRARGLFRVSSLLNMRGSSSATKKGSDEDRPSATPVPSSPRDNFPSLQRFDFGMGKQKNPKSSRKLGGHERDKDPAHGLDLQLGLYSSGGTPPLQDYFNLPSFPIEANAAIQNTARSTKPHDWKQWNKMEDSETFLPVNESDFVWHRPTFRQIIESLQVAILSGETICETQSTTAPWKSYPGLKQPSMSRAKCRSFSPNLSTWSTIGSEHPIPGRYRSHIMRAIEGIRDIQVAYDSTKDRVTEVEEAYGRALQLFSELSKEWAERERKLEAEIDQLRADFLALKSSSSV
ncbi:MAG: hypothetical protein SEPTF4163_005166 [Sporothrix epigloea]